MLCSLKADQVSVGALRMFREGFELEALLRICSVEKGNFATVGLAPA
jgi:hypothetical protein